MDVRLVVHTFRYFAAKALGEHGTLVRPSGPIGSQAQHLAYIEREPVGVVGAVIPWKCVWCGSERSSQRPKSAGATLAPVRCADVR